jgi:hypothetical protein
LPFEREFGVSRKKKKKGKGQCNLFVILFWIINRLSFNLHSQCGSRMVKFITRLLSLLNNCNKITTVQWQLVRVKPDEMTFWTPGILQEAPTL